MTALYNSPDPSVKSEANAWLTSFAASPEAWGPCTAIAASAAPGPGQAGALPDEVVFFAANILHSKVSSEWATCPPEVRPHVSAHFLRFVHALLSPGAHDPHGVSGRGGEARGVPQAHRELPDPLVTYKVVQILVAIALKPQSQPQGATSGAPGVAAGAPGAIDLGSLLDQALLALGPRLASLASGALRGDELASLRASCLAACSLVGVAAEEAGDADRVTQSRVLPVLRVSASAYTDRNSAVTDAVQ